MDIKINKKGAEITSIVCNDKEFLYQPKDDEQKGANATWNRQFPILFPIVGKLINDCYSVNDNFYFIGQNGFVQDLKFEMVKNEEEFDVDNEYIRFKKGFQLINNEETLKKYPFNFRLYVEYSYDEQEEKNTINVKANIKKLDKNVDMPFKIRFKPAFKCNYSTGNFRLYFKSRLIPKQGQGLVINRDPMKTINGLVDFDIYDGMNKIRDRYLRLNKDSFLNDALIYKNMDYMDIYLEEYVKDLDAWDRRVRLSTQEFKYISIWSKPEANFITIEPWSGNTQVINTQIREKLENKEYINYIDNDPSFDCLKQYFVFDSEDKTFSFKLKFYDDIDI